MDLSKIDLYDNAEQGTTVHVADPAGEPTDIEIDVVGGDSPTFRDALRWYRNEMAKARKQHAGVVPAHIEDRLSAGLYARATLGWRNIEADGEAVPFSVGKATDLYEEHPWLSKQVAEGAGDRDRFLSISSEES